MTATTHSTGDEPRESPGDATDLTAREIAPDQDAGGVLVGAASNLCSNCGAALATDQKYCVECGTRRGIPRFRVAGADDHKADAHLQPAPPVSAPPAISSRLLALLAVIVVLAAIALGFVIGNSSSTTTVRLTGVSGVTAAKTSGASTSGSGAKSASTGSSKSSSASSSGSSCTAGSPGCKNGKQTGNFFGS